METLVVMLLGKRVGVLEYSNGMFSFIYDKDYLANSDAVPISYSLPLRPMPFDNDAVKTFFENLLPPDNVRKRLGKILHLSRNNIFGFRHVPQDGMLLELSARGLKPPFAVGPMPAMDVRVQTPSFQRRSRERYQPWVSAAA